MSVIGTGLPLLKFVLFGSYFLLESFGSFSMLGLNKRYLNYIFLGLSGLYLRIRVNELKKFKIRNI
jgi:hypothetical protein